MLTDFLGKLKRRNNAAAGQVTIRAPRAFCGMVVVAVLIAVAATVPAVRFELRRSFTKAPALFAELYFTRLPFLESLPDGLSVIVPIAVVDHNPGTTTHRINVWLAAPGEPLATPGEPRAAPGEPLAAPSTARLDARQDRPAATTVRVRAASRGPGGADAAATGLVSDVVFVALVGHPQQLHYRLKLEDMP